jgi:hypothetical protein
MRGKVGIELNTGEALIEAPSCIQGTKVTDTSLLELWSTGVHGPVETVPRSRRREANSPNASCLCGTWHPRGSLEESSHPLASAGQLCSGHRRAQEAKAGTPKGTGNPSPAG